MRSMGITDLARVYTERDLAPGREILFAASGVTQGTLLQGVRFFAHGRRVNSVLMSLHERRIRFVDTVHIDEASDFSVEF